jgi:hypothetical protein
LIRNIFRDLFSRSRTGMQLIMSWRYWTDCTQLQPVQDMYSGSWDIPEYGPQGSSIDKKAKRSEDDTIAYCASRQLAHDRDTRITLSTCRNMDRFLNHRHQVLLCSAGVSSPVDTNRRIRCRRIPRVLPEPEATQGTSRRPKPDPQSHIHR